MLRRQVITACGEGRQAAGDESESDSSHLRMLVRTSMARVCGVRAVPQCAAPRVPTRRGDDDELRQRERTIPAMISPSHMCACARARGHALQSMSGIKKTPH
eukprot:4767251-Prymnesium_polylepis.1